MRIVVEGNFSPVGSYGIVNANLGRALSQRGHEVAFVSLDLSPADLDMLISSDPGLAGLEVSAGEPECPPDVRIRLMWPPIWVRRNSVERLIVSQPWEFGSLPLSWLDGIENVDAIWVFSEYCKREYIQSGVDPAKVWVVPIGFDADTISPKPSSIRGKTKLLYLGGTIFRKGIDVLIRALDSLDDKILNKIDLVVKETGSDSFYANQSLLAEALTTHPRVKARTVVDSRHLARDQVLDLIYRSDALVHPYRAEGFGMPILEAMALGTPVIHTQGGASNEFCGAEESLLIPSTLTVADSPVVGDLLLSDKCYWVEPSVEQLARLIGEIVDDGIDRSPMVEAAKKRALGLSWLRVAEIAENAIRDLLRCQEPSDSLSELVADLAFMLKTGEQSVAPLLSRLVAVGDLGTAFRLAAHVERNTDTREAIEIASVRERLASLMVVTEDVWSGGPYRSLVAGAEFEKVERFGFVHDFEGGDQATFKIARYLSNYFANCRSVLDLACGQGSMMRVLRGQGKIVQGVEADPVLVSEMRSDGFTIFEGFIPSDLFNLEMDSFDGVFLGHIVEHLHPSEVEKVLDWIFDNIADGGTIVIQTPDFANPSVGSENFWLDASHIRPYPIRLLKAMLTKTGFVPIEGACRRVPEIAPLDAIVVGRRLSRVHSFDRGEEVLGLGQVRLGHYGLFSGSSGFAQASKVLFDNVKLFEDGIQVTEISVNQGPSGEVLSNRPIIPLRLSERVRSDIAVIDVPVGWLSEVSPLVRAKYRIARTTFEGMPLGLSFQRAACSFDEVWCFSHYDAEILANSRISKESIFVMAPGIELPDPEGVRTLRARAKRNSFRFLSIFNFEPRKNPEALMKAFSHVAVEVPSSELILKLSGISAEDFGSWLVQVLSPAEINIVKSRTHVLTDNLSRDVLLGLYVESDVFVLPTRGEGYGLPFLEALAHGLPTICPDVGGHRDFCNDGNSLLVNTTSVPASIIRGAEVFRESFWREVDLDDLVKRMLEAATGPELLARLSSAGLSDSGRFGVASYQAASRSRIAQVVSEIKKTI